MSIRSLAVLCVLAGAIAAPAFAQQSTDASRERVIRIPGYPPGRMGEYLYYSDLRLHRERFGDVYGGLGGVRIFDARGLVFGLIEPLRNEVRAIKDAAREDRRSTTVAERERIKVIQADIRRTRKNPTTAVTVANLDHLLKRKSADCRCRAVADPQLVAQLQQQAALAAPG